MNFSPNCTPSLLSSGASLVAQLVKNPPAMQETRVQFLGWEDPLEKGSATHSSILGFPWWLGRPMKPVLLKAQDGTR